MKKLIALEFFKLKRSMFWLVILLFPLLSALWGTAFVLIFRAVPEDIRKNISQELLLNGGTWELLYTGSSSLFMPLMLPILTALIMTWLNRAEHQQHLWKSLLTLPIQRSSLFIGKLVTGILLMLISITAYSVFMLSAGFVLGDGGPVPFDLLLLKPLLSGLTALPIVLLYLELSIFFSNPVIPVAVGGILTLPVMLVANSEKLWLLYPWSYPAQFALGSFSGQEDLLAAMTGICILLTIVLLFSGITGFRKKDII